MLADDHEDVSCYVCNYVQGHAEYCRIRHSPLAREGWDLVAGFPCGVDKQFLEEMKISWQ